MLYSFITGINTNKSNKLLQTPDVSKSEQIFVLATSCISKFGNRDIPPVTVPWLTCDKITVSFPSRLAAICQLVAHQLLSWQQAASWPKEWRRTVLEPPDSDVILLCLRPSPRVYHPVVVPFFRILREVRHGQKEDMDYKSVVFNAAREGNLNILKVGEMLWLVHSRDNNTQRW